MGPGDKVTPGRPGPTKTSSQKPAPQTQPQNMTPQTKTKQIMMIPKLEDQLEKYNTAFSELYTVGQDSKVLAQRLQETLQYQPSSLDTKIIENSLRKTLEGMIREYVVPSVVQAVEREFNKVIEKYTNVRDMIREIANKYSDKDKLVENLKKIGAPEEVIKSVEQAKDIHRALTNLDQYYSNRIEELKIKKEEVKEAIQKALPNVISAYIDLFIKNVVEESAKMYNSHVNPQKVQVEEDRERGYSRMREINNNVVTLINELIEKLGKELETLEEQEKALSEVVEGFRRQQNLGAAMRYERELENVSSMKAQIQQRIEYYRRGINDIKLS